MGSVVEFKRPEKELPHATGEAFCARCDHTWVAVAPVGTTLFECPNCHTHGGMFKFMCAPEAPVWNCPCGNQLFYITTEGHFCPNCGIWQRYK